MNTYPRNIKEPLLSSNNQIEIELQNSISQHERTPSKIDDELNNLKYQKISFWDWIFFSDVRKFRQNIKDKPNPQLEDIPPPYDMLNIKDRLDRFWAHWEKSKSSQDPKLILKILIKSFPKESIILFLLSFFTQTLALLSVNFLGKLMFNITNLSLGLVADYDTMINLAIIVVLTKFFAFFTSSFFWLYGYVVTQTVASTLNGVIYQKITKLTLESVRFLDLGKTLNLMSNDMGELAVDLLFVPQQFLGPYTIILGSYFVWEQFGPFSLISLVLLYASLKMNDYYAQKVRPIVAENNIIRDKRIKVTSEMIENIKSFKMYAWDGPFQKRINDEREAENSKFLSRTLNLSLAGSIQVSSPYICMIVLAIVYTYFGGILSPEKVYTTLMLLDIIKSLGLRHYQVYSIFTQKFKSFNSRLREILNAEEIKRGRIANNIQGEDSQKDLIEMRDLEGATPFVRLVSYSFQNQQTKEFVLKNISFEFRNKGLIAIVGKIGSGKSCLLLSILKELSNENIEKIQVQGRTAIVEQEASIFPGTVKDNILFGKSYNEKLYNDAISKSGLKDDLETFENGDQTKTLEKGANFSGGQKSRICLARAYYSQSQIFLLDDPLSALDGKVANYIFSELIQELASQKIVFMATHNLFLASKADTILMLNNGSISFNGSFQDLKNDKEALKRFKHLSSENIKRLRSQASSSTDLEIFDNELSEAQKDENEDKVKQSRVDDINIKEQPLHQQDPSKSSNSSLPKRKPTQNDNSQNKSIKQTEEYDDKLINKALAEEVSFSTLWRYLRTGLSYWKLLILIIVFCLGCAILIVFQRVIGIWSTETKRRYIEEGENSVGFHPQDLEFLGIIIGLTIFLILIEQLKTYLTYKSLLSINSTLHSKLLSKICNAKLQVLEKIRFGTLINRFSGDMSGLDKGVINLFKECFHGYLNLAFFMGTLIYIFPFTIPLCGLVIYCLVGLYKRFEKIVETTRKYLVQTMSPLFSEILTAVGGLVVIRAFNQSKRFINQFIKLLYATQGPATYAERSFRLYRFVQDFGSEIFVSVSLFAMIMISQSDIIEPSIFGLAIFSLNSVNNLASWTTKRMYQLKVCLQSYQRITCFYDIEQEGIGGNDKLINNTQENHIPNWPSKGEIIMKNVFMRYGPDLPYVLKGVNLIFKPGTKNAIIGRTGSGKSSIFMSLFKFVEIDKEKESLITIDEVNITKIDVQQLRSQLGVIPQSPILLDGSVRRNIDPLGNYKDDEIVDVLESVQLDELGQQLDSDIFKMNLSAGQKQLINVCRVLLDRKKVVLCDEISSALDPSSEKMINTVLTKKLKNSTIVAIAHKLASISNFDNLVVLQGGKIIEEGHPYSLIVENIGDFEITNQKGYLAQMVLQMGEQQSQQFFDIARKCYFDKDE